MYWKVDVSRKCHAGDEAGTLNNAGYLKVGVHGKVYPVHRILWVLYTKKPIPKGLQIDHINRKRSDNRWKNLRLVTRRENHQNRSDQREYHNLFKRHSGRFTVQIGINGKYTYFGTYPLAQAIKVRDRILAGLD